MRVWSDGKFFEQSALRSWQTKKGSLAWGAMENTDPLRPSLKQIALDKFGIDLENPAGESVEVTPDKLLAALEAAYHSGRGSHAPLGLKQGLDESGMFRRLMESLPDHVWYKDLDSKFIMVNNSLSKFFGFDSPEEVIGKTDVDMFQSKFAEKKLEAERKIIETGQGWSFREERDRQADGSEKYVLSTKLPLKNEEGEIVGTFGLARDITEKKYMEIELDRQRQLLQTILQILPCRVFVRDKNQHFLHINEAYREEIGAKSKEEVIGRRLEDFVDPDHAKELAAGDKRIIETGEPILGKIAYGKNVRGESQWMLTSKVPLINSEEQIDGVVGMTLDVTEHKEAEEEARRANAELEDKNQQLETELLVARQLQEQLMSMGFNEQTMFSKSGNLWTMEASYLYSPSHHLAGDFFYLIPVSEDKMGILVCDVMGHGIKAALVTMLIRGLLLERPSALKDPAKVLAHLNDKLIPLAEDKAFPRFVTAVYSVIDLARGEISIANAGHPDPLRYINNHNGNHFEECHVKEMGPALGMFPDEPYSKTKFKLKEDTELLFYTDGIIEQKRTDGEEFGLNGLLESFDRVKNEELNNQLHAVSDDLKKSAGTAVMQDDVCMVAVRLRPSEVAVDEGT